MVDSTGVGDPVLEELQVEHGNFFGYNFSPASKQKLMEGLAVSIQSREISFPKGYIPSELEMFEYEERPNSAQVRYSAPEGHNDDCVCSLALARQMWTEVQPGQNLMAFYGTQVAQLREREAEMSKENNRPWQSSAAGFDVEVGDLITNELEELYNEVVAKTLGTATRNCFACSKPVTGNARVSDGENVWHTQCAGANARPRLSAEAIA